MRTRLEDPARLVAVGRTELMDSGPEEAFDLFTRLAAQFAEAPIALVSLLDGRRQYFKSALGLDRRETPLSYSFCQHVVAAEGPVVISDTREDPRGTGNLAIDEFGVVAYCGVPLTDGEGHTLGALCVIDTKPHAWTDRDVTMLEGLAQSVTSELKVRVANHRVRVRERSLNVAHGALMTRERELAASERRFRRTFDDSSIGMAMTAPNGAWLEVNPKLAEIVGYEPAELLALDFRAITHPDDLESGNQALQALIDGSVTSAKLEKRYIHKQGHAVPVRLSIALVRDDDGTPMHFLSQIEDISQRRAAEAARQEIAQRHTALLENLPGTAVAMFDRDLVCIHMQGLAFATAGIDTQRYIGRRLGAPIPEDLVQRLEPMIRRALDGKSGRDTSTTVGSGRTFEMHTVPYRSPDGVVTAAIVVGRDITQLLAARQRDRMLATIVDQSEDAIIAMDRTGQITAWNRGAERLYGYTPAEAVGRPMSMLIPPERYGEDQRLLAPALAGEAVSGLETERIHKNGGRVYVSLSISPLVDEHGNASGASSIARDNTARVQAEAARKEAEERLRVTVEHAPIGVALVDLSHNPRPGGLISVNDAFGKLIGDDDPVGAGLRITSNVHPDDAEKVRNDLVLLGTHALARTEREVRWRRPDGRTTWVLLSGSAVPDDSAGPRTAVMHALDIGERKRFEVQLQYLADHDALTGLFNRRRLEEELERAIAGTNRHGRAGSVLLIDLDGFKHVNDLLGHAGGDELIAQIGGLLRRTLRKTDILARLGGDEFAVLLPDTSGEQAEIVAAKVANAVDQHSIALTEHRHPRVTASIGITSFTQHGGRDAEALLGEADSAMYEAKQAGRNQWAVHQSATPPTERTVVRESWLERLQGALDKDQFELMAQPIQGICATGGEFHELLLRLRGENGELIAPGTFLSNAERFDLIQQIDRWVLKQALEVLSDAQASGRALTLTVNMSAKTFSDPDICPDLAALLSKYPIQPGTLIVEVTETAAIVNIDTARHVARELRKLGCRLALDDFGAGFASFYYLKHLEFDYVKIDGEFVRSLASNMTDQLVIKSVVDIARGLGAQTIAEFVGDDDTVARLNALGVDYGQGYHLGRPEPISTALARSAA